ncbi:MULTISPECIES: SpaA isopeptide-forming pilin-related protein [unclassified Leucobacter]|uniref:SpaA isopeptide-forming pilin-related protein n=1 Tax=unclassified Leucobacter TaxID=2621730 RepID=UPI00165EA711|nr:SpaA isopeptide-forming pilin-related protein [Leucobacter sp. CX169]MBC9928638.1 VWA domain-containing protein [Leucobacter sp. cx-169]
MDTPAAPAADEAPAPPYLRWNVSDESGALVGDTSITVEGPRNDAVADDGNESQWQGVLSATVADNTGQAGYAGSDLDPVAGSFLVKQLVSDAEANVTHDVAAAEHFRVRPAVASEGLAVGDDAAWQELASAGSPDESVTAVALVPSPAPASAARVAPTEEPGIVALAAPPGAADFGYYGRQSDNSNPTTWTFATSAPGKSQVLNLSTSIQTSGSNFNLALEFDRESQTGTNAWYIEYTIAPERWGPASSPAASQVPQPDRSQGGTVIYIHQQGNTIDVLRICTYTSLATYATIGANCVNLPASVVVEQTTHVKLLVPLNSSTIGAPGCPPKLGSTAYVRATTGDDQLTGWGTPAELELGNYSTCGKIVINKRVIRASADNLEGATFRLYTGTTAPVAPIGDPWATCTIGAPPATSCTITLAAGQSGSRYWVVEETAAPGTFALNQIAVGSATGNLDPPIYYPGRTPVVNNGSTVQMPQTSSGDTASIGETTNALLNPTKPATCTAGLRIALVLDRSTSIEEDERGPYATAIRSLVNGLVTPANNILITPIMFNSSATVGSTTAASSALATSLYNTLNGGSGWASATNWDAAMQAAAGGPYDVVLMVTDGAPTQSRSGGADNVRIHHIEQAVLSANAVKAGGIPVIAVGVALPANALVNLQAISGRTAGQDYFNVAQWADLGADMTALAQALSCQVPIQVNKTEVAYNTNPRSGAEGWSFTAGSTGAGTTLTGTPTRNTPLNGGLTWTLGFSSTTGQTAAVTLSEPARAGWVFTSVVCNNVDLTSSVVTAPDGRVSITLSGLTAGSVAQSCVFTNTQLPPTATLTWSKVKAGTSTLLGGSVWKIVGPAPDNPELAVPDCTMLPCAGADQDPVAGQFTVNNLIWGDYTVTETSPPQGYSGSASFTLTVNSANAGTTINKGPFENTQLLGAATWTKVAKGTTDLLGGSTWKIVGTNPVVSEVVITDCISGPCAGPDTDPLAGKFALQDLAWGEYTVTETSAPQGYSGTASFSLTINAANAGTTVDKGAFENTKLLGSVTWNKVAKGTTNLLSGSEWKITGTNPVVADAAIVDCVSDPCGGLDKDPAAGKFELRDLAWGAYTIAETKAPPGYIGGATFDILVNAANAGTVIVHGAVENTQQNGVAIPLTGGMSTLMYTLAGSGIGFLALLLGLAYWRRVRRPVEVS